jgi:hypothetical protein
MLTAQKRTPTWLMVVMVAILALAIAAFAGVLDAGAKKKKKKAPATQIVERTAVLPNTGSCDPQNNCTGAVTTTATCPPGFLVTGGGIRLGNPNNEFVEGSYPTGKNSWTAVAFRGNNKTGNSTVTAIAVCRR